MNTDVPRFRFAPAPGRPPDLGHLHTAAFNWGLARALGGDFILRIEDGHSAEAAGREEEAAEEFAHALRWLGLDWDEGPDVGGPNAPYFQSQRQERYREVADQVAAAGDAYAEQHADGEPAIYLRRPEIHEIEIAEAVGGTLHYEVSPFSDPALIQTDGRASRLLAEVVDDHDMGVTHVARRQSESAMTPLQAHLFRSLKWKEPVWIHLPAIENTQGQSLSTEIAARDFREKGYLPEALFNYLLLLGWSPDDEILDRWKVRKQLEIEALSPGPAVFEWDRLGQINRRYLQERSDAKLTALTLPYLEEAYDLMGVNDAWLERLVGLIRPEMTRLADAPALAEWALSETFSFTEAAEEALAGDVARAALVRLVADLAHIVLLDEPTATAILESLHENFEAERVNGSIRAALTGRVQGPPLSQVMTLLGKQRCLNRIAVLLRA